MTTPSKTVALLIDGDNAQLKKYTEQIIRFCEGYGTLSIKKAYGDWNKRPLSSHREKIAELGITLVQQERGKNAADFALAMDAAVMLYKKEADIYFIVSSDADFTTVYQHIRQTGAEVYGIGNKAKSSGKMRKACNKFFDIENEIVRKQGKASAKSAPKTKAKSSTKAADIQKQSKPPAKSAPASKPETKPTTKEAEAKKQSKPSTKKRPAPKPKTILKKLKQAYQEVLDKNGSVHLSQFNEALSKLDKQFDKKKISTWLKMFPDTFEVEGHYVRMK